MPPLVPVDESVPGCFLISEVVGTVSADKGTPLNFIQIKQNHDIILAEEDDESLIVRVFPTSTWPFHGNLESLNLRVVFFSDKMVQKTDIVQVSAN